MLNCVFYSLFFILFLNLSLGSLKLSQINRTFISSYKGMYEASVITVGNDGEPIYPYFDQNILSNYIHTYFEKNLTRYTTNYTLDVAFYDQEGGNKCQINDMSRCVEVSLKADINFLFKYDKTQKFLIKDRPNL